MYIQTLTRVLETLVRIKAELLGRPAVTDLMPKITAPLVFESPTRNIIEGKAVFGPLRPTLCDILPAKIDDQPGEVIRPVFQAELVPFRLQGRQTGTWNHFLHKSTLRAVALLFHGAVTSMMSVGTEIFGRSASNS